MNNSIIMMQSVLSYTHLVQLSLSIKTTLEKAKIVLKESWSLTTSGFKHGLDHSIKHISYSF